MTTVIVGCGTIGLALGAALSSRGEEVVLHDRNPERLEAIADLGEDLGEPGLRDALRSGIENSLIRLSADLAAPLGMTNFIVCVPTSAGDLDNIADTVLDISSRAKENDAVIVRSTVPIGFVRRMENLAVSRGRRGLRFAAAPDRSIEGRSFADQFEVPHLVGGNDVSSADNATSLLGRLGRTVVLGSSEEAEAAKLFCNCWRMMTFAAANAMAMIAADHDISFANLRSRVSDGYSRFQIPRPGAVGGPCLPKDLDMLISTESAPSITLFEGVRRSEREFRRRVEIVAVDHLRGYSGIPTKVGFLGLSFKGNPPVADTRGSPALDLARVLRSTFPDLEMSGWDPAPVTVDVSGMVITSHAPSVVQGSALIVLGHDHSAVVGEDVGTILQNLAAGSLVIDLTGVYRPPTSGQLQWRLWKLGDEDGHV